MYMLLEAAKNGGGTDTESLVRGMTGMKFSGVAGDHLPRWKRRCHQAGGSQYLWRRKDQMAQDDRAVGRVILWYKSENRKGFCCMVRKGTVGRDPLHIRKKKRRSVNRSWSVWSVRTEQERRRSLICSPGVYQPTEGAFYVCGENMAGKKPHQVVASGVVKRPSKCENFLCPKSLRLCGVCHLGAKELKREK